MEMQKKRQRVAWLVLLGLSLFAFALANGASAKLVGEFTKFEQCPRTNPEAFKCLYSLNEGGEVVLGNKKVPIVSDVTIQGGFSKPVEGFSKFVAATNGVTLSKAAQPVPGGLLGIVPPEKSPPLVKALSAFFFENGLTGVDAVLELAKPASEIKISEPNLTLAEGVALKLPVKIHLENPFLGKSCYVGSSSSPLVWELTAGTTSPPKPNEPISGATGEVEFLEEGRIVKLNGNVLVDNGWSAPVATGCGGVLSFLVDPIINAQIGLPAAAGRNTAILQNTIYIATSAAVRKNDEQNP